MCGIVGVVGSPNATEVLITGLRKLEYRGYDSIGLSVFLEGKIQTVKTKGRIDEIQKKLDEHPLPLASVGIGHTRWATHGEPSDINSHPHGNHRISIVHNGIIENYIPIKERMIRKGYAFETQTDTEALAKLVDYYFVQKGTPLEAIKKVLEKIRGSFAVGIMFVGFPDELYAIRKDSPLIIGLGKDMNFVASDMTAILKYTRDYILLEENEIAIVKKDSVQILDLDLEEITKEIQHAHWDEQTAEKGGYPHFMLKEIHEQPKSFTQTVSPRLIDGNVSFEGEGISDEMLKGVVRITMVACGTAMHAAMVGKSLIEKMARVPVDVDVASEFRYRDPVFLPGDLVVIVSQSGETADTLAALRLAKRNHVPTLAIVNVVGSSIAREADYVLYTWAGLEIAVASTKAFFVQMAVFFLLALKLAELRQSRSEEELGGLLEDFLKIPDLVQHVLEHHGDCKLFASKLQNSHNLLYLGRGLDYSLSLESSLKLKEISYVHSEAYPAGELKHGTISLITKDFPVIALATQVDLYEKMVSNIKEVKARGARVLLVCRENAPYIQDVADMVFTLPDVRNELMPFLSIVPMQLFAYYSSVLRGCDVDKPRNLAKSVTVE
ncbi:MAG: glutamine--fructose-6-phosphate aminotransferase [Firmicutes bacterium GWF2_51_9]|nr:MAG: glutamine--fructose-6-phosphate aminotransferase [Firmicutes bacterium GWF2_51_9]OGS57831.1 MAG: glutamine--fructose-6-phosphate aminotransferase [Firmicutes bacterium GWE2_51_13]HAM63217.1 glutamine--fructose-6-phosphate transaminase (isomerizing) [Erysipelotrichaceae bacterium]HBZ41389.1 glutamine--fructose-6-phosphate transaminase (isomerizing) [Erysipelotrichaceae bacterium]